MGGFLPVRFWFGVKRKGTFGAGNKVACDPDGNAGCRATGRSEDGNIEHRDPALGRIRCGRGDGVRHPSQMSDDLRKTQPLSIGN